MTVPSTTPALEVVALRKSFGETDAVDGVDLHVAAGTRLHLPEREC